MATTCSKCGGGILHGQVYPHTDADCADALRSQLAKSERSHAAERVAWSRAAEGMRALLREARQRIVATRGYCAPGSMCGQCQPVDALLSRIDAALSAPTHETPAASTCEGDGGGR